MPDLFVSANPFALFSEYQKTNNASLTIMHSGRGISESSVVAAFLICAVLSRNTALVFTRLLYIANENTRYPPATMTARVPKVRQCINSFKIKQKRQ